MPAPTLLPLSQWVCDSCSQLIRHAEDGSLEFSRSVDSRINSEFRIVHHRTASPPSIKRRCDRGEGPDVPLTEVAGVNMLARTLGLICQDRWIAERERSTSEIDVATGFDLIKRLCLPFYEEARYVLPRDVENDIHLTDLRTDGECLHAVSRSVFVHRLIDEVPFDVAWYVRKAPAYWIRLAAKFVDSSDCMIHDEQKRLLAAKEITRYPLRQEFIVEVCNGHLSALRSLDVFDSERVVFADVAKDLQGLHA